MRIVIAPFSARLSNGKLNPKNYPVRWWVQVIARLNVTGADVVQLGVAGEQRLEGVAEFLQGWPLPKLRDVVRDADLFISVDTWLPHFVYSERLGVRGVVIFGPSDPALWGHDENINLLKHPKYLRQFQYQDWVSIEYDEAAFVLPHVVIEAVQQLLTASHQPADRTVSLVASI